MSHLSRNVWRVLALWTILVGAVGSAAAQDEDPFEDGPVNVGGRVAESNFDRWVFQEVVQVQGNRRVLQSNTAVAARAKIDSQLKSKLDELVKVCDLTEAQQRTLSLAARGDIKQFFDQVEEVRKKFLAVKDDQKGLNQIFTEIQPLQLQFGRGLFGEESLFAKKLRKTLNEEQMEKYRVELLDQRRVGYRTTIETSLTKLGPGFVLRREQRQELLKLLLEETAPPLEYGQYDQQVIMLRLSQLPAAKLKAVLDKAQWKQLQPQLLQASGTEDNLALHGVIEEPKPNSVVILRSVRTVVLPENAIDTAR